MSLKARDLIKEALELFEDSYWIRIAQERENTYAPSEALSHKQVWDKLLKKERNS